MGLVCFLLVHQHQWLANIILGILNSSNYNISGWDGASSNIDKNGARNIGEKRSGTRNASGRRVGQVLLVGKTSTAPSTNSLRLVSKCLSTHIFLVDMVQV